MFGLWKRNLIKEVSILGNSPTIVETTGVYAESNPLTNAVLHNEGYEFIGYVRTSTEVTEVFNAIGVTKIRWVGQPTVTFEEVAV